MTRRAPFPMLAALVLAAGLVGPALAVSDPAEMLANPVQEKRAEQIGRQLRCLVCQNEDIEDSGADLARDLRHIVRGQVAAGRTNRQIMDWMVARYGNFVRLSPPVTAATLLLWFMPVLALLVGFGALAVGMRRRPSAPPAPLTDDERGLLAEITSRH